MKTEEEKEFKSANVWYRFKMMFIRQKNKKLPEKLYYSEFIKNLDLGIEATGGIIGDTYKITDEDKWKEAQQKYGIVIK